MCYVFWTCRDTMNKISSENVEKTDQRIANELGLCLSPMIW